MQLQAQLSQYVTAVPAEGLTQLCVRQSGNKLGLLCCSGQAAMSLQSFEGCRSPLKDAEAL